MSLEQRDLKTKDKKGGRKVRIERKKRAKVRKFQQMRNTYVGIDINVWRQACQSVHIDIVVTELRGGRPSSCTSGGRSSLG